MFSFLILNPQIIHESSERLRKREIIVTAATTFQSSGKVRSIFFFFLFRERNSSRPHCIKSTFEIVNISRVFCSPWRVIRSAAARNRADEMEMLTLNRVMRPRGKVHVSGASGRNQSFPQVWGRGEVATRVHHPQSGRGDTDSLH